MNREVNVANVKKWKDGDCWVEIDLDLCKGAAECVKVCPSSVYEIFDGKINAENIGACIECGACQGTCPHNAILKHWAWV
jgi:NAD-dependent dihydropyrimidine dehydrogenase PreA subunit